MSKLFICEKPSQARDIARNLGANQRQEGFIEGNNAVVTWCYGHLLELAPPDYYCENLKPWRMQVLPIVPETWHIVPTKNGKKQFNIIKKLLKKTAHVVIATDADREGDVIGREVLDLCGFKGKVDRLWLSALDDVSIKKALQNIKPGSATENLYRAGLGRQRADWLVGMNLTMATSALFGIPGQGVLSVGRVQTPTLKLIVDRDLEVENFKSKNYFELKAQFETAKGETFWTNWKAPEEYSDDAGHCLDSKKIEEIAQRIHKNTGTILSFTDSLKKVKPPLCFSLSSLQKAASSQFGLPVKQTLDIAQSLYEKHKATTYPRTDCGYLPESQFDEAERVLSAISQVDPDISDLVTLCDKSYRSPAWNNKKITAHHGIMPTTNQHVNLAVMSDEERKVYDLIRRYYMAQFLHEYQYSQRQVNVRCENETFSASENTPIKLGWKQALNASQLEQEEGQIKDATNNAIPKLTEKDVVSLKGSSIETKQTKPPARFTEGSLIATMKSVAKYVDDPSLKKVLKETAGIGTEATRANILETLLNRHYISRKGKQLISSSKGRDLIALLPEIVKNPATTARWEQMLDEIASGQSKLDDFFFDQVDVLEGMLDQLSSLKAQGRNLKSDVASHPCPDCKQSMYRRKGKKGYFWACSGFPGCKKTLADHNGKPGV